MSFCKDFNAKTADYKANVLVPVKITAYQDKTFNYVMRSPPASFFVKKAAGLSSASTRPGHIVAGAVTLKHIYEIAKVKQSDPGQGDIPLKSFCQSIMGTCRSMGIKVMTKAEMEELEIAEK
eukprot:CAMPEP_0196592846 /NCGR_PEP_ID=MMETSP1081-20130531/74020_1 /TAXON_ID=36882 /ORGANISM="Pyramimonas amylifera, Strain CCMP720" /LENGTH=121 /DNA_ID=CAMNT_0041916659 /DNA_START=209 /DNA_END=574 /DNA_ORIENTATION=-